MQPQTIKCCEIYTLNDCEVQLVHHLYLIFITGNGKQGRPEAHGKVIGVHEVLITKLSQVTEEGKQVSHNDDAGLG